MEQEHEGTKRRRRRDNARDALCTFDADAECRSFIQWSRRKRRARERRSQTTQKRFRTPRTHGSQSARRGISACRMPRMGENRSPRSYITGIGYFSVPRRQPQHWTPHLFLTCRADTGSTWRGGISVSRASDASALYLQVSRVVPHHPRAAELVALCAREREERSRSFDENS